MAHRRLSRAGRVDVVARVRQEMRELALDTRDDEIARSALRRGEERVLSAPCALQRVGDLILRSEDGRVAEIELGEHQGVARGMFLGDLRQLRRLLAPHQVVGELEKVDRDARLEQRILYMGQDLVELCPRQIERLE